ncbi:MAG: gliding motility-associated-like protein [Flavobacteriales bacterium]|jgi:gliding motility-associated-like protein
MKTTSTLLLLCVSLAVLGQSDCFPPLYIGEDTLVDCDSSCITLLADYENIFETTSYTVSALTETAPPFPISDGTNIIGGIDDIYSGLIPIPFSFNFFGDPYESIVIGSNGVCTFEAGEANGVCPWQFTETNPNNNLPTTAIFCPYHDIDPSDCGNVKWISYGEEPCRTFVVNFQAICLYNCSVQTSSQLVLYESTNVIEVYLVNKPSCGWNNGATLLGIQNANGNVGYTAPGRNTGNWTAANEAWQFSPNGDPLNEITWFVGNEIVGTGDEFLVCPDSTTTYFAAMDCDVCEGELEEDCADYHIEVTSGLSPTDIFWRIVDENDMTLMTEFAPYDEFVCLENGCYTFELFDSFGNGWQGAQITLTTPEDEILVDTTLTSGSQLVVPFCVDSFDPDDINPFDSYFQIDSVTIMVTQDNVNPGLIDPGTIFCVGSDPVQIEFDQADGLWESDCGTCLDETGLFDFTELEEGSYSVNYTLVGLCGPITDEIQIEVQAYPSIEIDGPLTLCETDDPEVYSSNLSNGSWSANCVDCIDGISGSFDPASSGAGMYEITYTSGNLCASESSITIEVENLLVAEINPMDAVCESSVSALLTASQPGGTWSADCGGCINSSTGVFNPSTSGPGNFIVTYSYESPCATGSSIALDVFPAVDASIGGIQELCESGSTLQLNAGNTDGEWSAECGSCLSSTGEFDPQLSGPGSFTVSHEVLGICSDYDDVDIVVLSQKDATIMLPEELCLDAISWQAEAADGGGIWSTDCLGCIDPSTGWIDIIEAGEGLHTIEYLIAGLCGDSDEVDIIIVPCEIVIPNIITPNDDGSNDFLVFKDLEYFPGSTVQVFNRWGKQMFASEDYRNNWDAQGVSDGTYYFILVRNDGVEYKGNLTIKRQN